MTMAELLPLFHGRNTIRLADGKFGLVIATIGSNTIGVQVDGEEDIRWAPLEDVIHIGEGELFQGSKTISLQRVGITLYCSIDFLGMVDPKTRHHYFASKLDDHLRDQGRYRAGPVQIVDDFEVIKAAAECGLGSSQLHITVQITADSASMLRPRNKSSKTKTPSLERERLDSIG